MKFAKGDRVKVNSNYPNYSEYDEAMVGKTGTVMDTSPLSPFIVVMLDDPYDLEPDEYGEPVFDGYFYDNELDAE